MLPRRLLAMVFVSGASGLIHEVLWVRALGLHFGTTVVAVSTVLAAFMGGMAVGSLVFGALADRSRRPFRLYRNIEVGIGFSASAVSLLVLRADSFLTALAQFSEAAGPAADIVRLTIFSSLILVPSTLIGGTLVVLSRGVMSDGRSGRVVGTLYAANTAGAVLGALAPDLVFIPQLGLTRTALLAGSGNLAVALAAMTFDRGAVATVEETTVDRPPESSPSLVLYGASGLCAMGIEVLWSRTLIHWSAASARSFAVLLAVFLLAIALGSWASRRIADRVVEPMHWGAAAVALTGPAMLLPIALAPAWRDTQRAWLPLPPDLRTSFGFNLSNAAMHAVYLELPACLLMGAALPFLASASVRTKGAGRQTARLYAVNTFAGVMGSLVVGFLWLPRLGELNSFLAVALLSSLSAAAVALTLPNSPLKYISLGCLPATLLAALIVPFDHLHRAHFRGDGHVLKLVEGTTTTAGVAQHYEFGAPAHRELVTPGVSMSDTSFGARRYMSLMGHLGVFFSDRPRRSLLICYGVGNTAQALLSHPKMQLDVVDISEEVLSLSSAFQTRDPLRDPRSRIFVDDGRHHLLVRDIEYDVITSEPPPPYHAGVVNLYSREFYRIARSRLRRGGVITQWLPVFQLSHDDIRTAVAAFVAEFPHTGLFYGHGHQWVLVGSEAPLRVRHRQWLQRLEQPSVAANLRAIGIESVEGLYATWLWTDAELRALAREAPALSDDLPSIQYPRQSVRVYPNLPRVRPTQPRVLAAMQESPSPVLRERIERATATLDGVFEMLDQRGKHPVELLDLQFTWRLAGLWSKEFGREAVFGLAALDGETAGRAQRLLTLHPATHALLGQDPARTLDAAHGRARDELELATLTLAKRATLMGNPRATIDLLDGLRPSEHRAAVYHLWRGLAARSVGDPVEATKSLKLAVRFSHSTEFQRRLSALMRGFERDSGF